MADQNRTVEITAERLPLYCPPHDANSWAMHPKVFLDVSHTGEATCPYCGAHYLFRGELPQGAH